MGPRCNIYRLSYGVTMFSSLETRMKYMRCSASGKRVVVASYRIVLVLRRRLVGLRGVIRMCGWEEEVSSRVRLYCRAKYIPYMLSVQVKTTSMP